MSRFILFFMSVICAVANSAATDFPSQSLEFSIKYKCGFLEETAAHARIDISCYDGNFNAILGGRTTPILGIIYCVNDTLQSTFAPSGITDSPANENVQYISGYYRKPHVDETIDLASPHSYKNINGGGYLSASDATMTCVAMTADLLCMFYYAKTVEFDRMREGVAVYVPMEMQYGGSKTLMVIYEGVKQYNGRSVYHLTCNVSVNGELTPYPVTVYIDRELRIPTLFSASIAIGEVQMEYRF